MEKVELQAMRLAFNAGSLGRNEPTLSRDATRVYRPPVKELPKFVPPHFDPPEYPVLSPGR